MTRNRSFLSLVRMNEFSNILYNSNIYMLRYAVFLACFGNVIINSFYKDMVEVIVKFIAYIISVFKDLLKAIKVFLFQYLEIFSTLQFLPEQVEIAGFFLYN